MLEVAEFAHLQRGAGEPVGEPRLVWGISGRNESGGGPSTSSPSANLAGALGDF